MPTVEVRCCCDANRLMGDMDVPFIGREGDAVYLDAWDGNIGIVVLQWGLIKYGTGHVCPALIANEVPIETLRTIPEFKERTE